MPLYLFLIFLFLFAFYTQGCDRSCPQPSFGDILFAGFTDSECAHLDAFKGVLYLAYQLSFPVAYPECEIAVRLQGCPVGRIRHVFIIVAHVGDGFSYPIKEFLKLLVKEFFKRLQAVPC